MESSSQIGGRYTLLRPLGEGATKEVFLARDEALQREVALCKFKPHVLSEGYLDRIRREAKTLGGLNHPNIVGIHDIREDDGCYLITEYVAGGSLREKIASGWKKHPNIHELLGIAIEVADALAETHAKGIFHRDVKPNNVLLTADGTAKLGDFGLARMHGDESISEEGLIVGTVPYMSPEQAKGLPSDSPGDMYSFGIVLFEMVAGRRPFHGDDASVLIHHLHTPPPPPTRYVPGCPPRLEALILQLLDKEPEARPTASDAAKELRRIAGVSAPGTVRRHAILTATLVLGVMAGFMMWWRPWVALAPPIPIEQVCSVNNRLVYDVSTGPARASDLPSLYEISADNQPLFRHINRLREMHRDGAAHRGMTYVYGAPGVGKTFLVRNHLSGAFPGDPTCVVKLNDAFRAATERLATPVTERADVTSIDDQVVIGRLPTIAEPNDFRLVTLLAASGCEENGVLRSLTVIDDIDEIHPNSSRLILRAVDQLVLESDPASSGFLHVIVVGMPDGFAPWFRDPKRHGGIARLLSLFELKGPVYSTTGDLDVLATDVLRLQMGKEGWERALRDGTASSLKEQYARYVRRHPFLTYSIRSLAVATHISVRSSTTPNDTEFELKEFILYELLRRASNFHGRPDPADDAYRRVLEAVASRYAERLDDNGFFVVGLDDRVLVKTSGGNTSELRVRDVLDRSGISFTVPGSHSTARYRFAPIWVQSHLIELANRRRDSNHEYRSCAVP